ncbi:MAG: glutamyl-tRNA reductase [Acidimicrobiales bacterium]
MVAIGATHRSAPLALLERLSIDETSMEKYLHDLTSRDHVTEAVIVSTCNRIEIFVTAEKFHGAYRDVRDFISDITFMAPEEFSDHLEVSHDADAVRHLFSVAAGLESVVVGEHEILGQVRDAWTTARTAGATGATLNLLFRHALEAGKRARTETDIARHVTSVSHAAVIMASELLGTLADRSVVVVGAGSMARGVVDFVGSHAVGDLSVINRTAERARVLAADLHQWADLDGLADAIARADVVFCATSAPAGVVDADMVTAAMATRPERPLLLVDIAMPRDVAPETASVPGVTLLDMDGLRQFAERGLSKRRREIPAVQEIVEQEVERYLGASSAREVTPLIVELRRRGDSVVADELQRHASKLAGLDDAQRQAVEGVLRGVVAKLLHEPTVVLKDTAGSPRGERLVGSLRELFDL